MLIMNKWKITWVKCGCLIVAVAALGFLGFVGFYFLLIIGAAGIESGLNVSGNYHALQRNADRTPQWSADGQTLVVNLGDEIYGASVDGNRLWRVAYKDTEHSRSGAFAPSLSVNGEVAYLKYYKVEGWLTNPDGYYHIEMIDINEVNATEPNQLFSEARRSGAPKWSPNGSRLAFSTFSTDDDLTIMTKRELEPSSDLKSILTFWRKDEARGKYDTLSIPGKGWRIFWSNDSQRIAFIEQWPSRIVNMQWDGADEKIAMEQKRRGDEFRPALFEPTSLAWSPTDDRIYFVYYELMDGEDAGHYRYTPSMRSVRPDGSDERIIAVWTEGFRVKGLKLSPDGSQLLFTTYRSPKDSGVRLSDEELEELYVMSADGSDAKKVFEPVDGVYTRGRTAIYASWSPDGSRIAVHNLAHGGNVFTISPDGSDARVVIGPGVQPGYGKPLQEALGR